VRFVVSANDDPGGLRAEPHADAVAGADDGVGLFAVALGDPNQIADAASGLVCPRASRRLVSSSCSR